MASARASMSPPVATHTPLRAISQSSRPFSVTSIANLAGESRKTNQQERAIRLRETEKRRQRQERDGLGGFSEFVSGMMNHGGQTRPRDRSRKPDRQWRREPRISESYLVSIKLASLRKSLASGARSPEDVWQSAQQLYDTVHPSEIRGDVRLSNQMIDLALQCGKSKEARTLYLSIQKEGGVPDVTTIRAVLVGILRKSPTPENTQLCQWSHDCYEELEKIRTEAFSSQPTHDGTPFMRMRMRNRGSTEEQELSSSFDYYREKALEQIRMRPWDLSSPYSAYVACCIFFGQDDRAWEIIQRAGDQILHPHDGFPPLNMLFLGRWMSSYAAQYGGPSQIPEGIYQRTHILVEKWWHAMQANMDPIQRQHEQALAKGDRTRANDIVSAWKSMIPSEKDMNNLINMANFRGNVDFQALSLDVLTSFTTFDFGDSPPQPPKRLRLPFGTLSRGDDDKDNPLASLIPLTPKDYSLLGQQDVSAIACPRVFHLAHSLSSYSVSLRDTAYEAAMSMILRIAQEELEHARRRGLESRITPSPSPLPQPEPQSEGTSAPTPIPDPQAQEAAYEDRLAEYRRLFDIADVWHQYLATLPWQHPQAIPKTMRVLSTLRELHQARLVSKGPDSHLYWTVLHPIAFTDERSGQICRWWMEDNDLSKLPTREQVEARDTSRRSLTKSRAHRENPWTVDVVMISHRYAMSVWESAGAFWKMSTKQSMLKGKGKSDKEIIAEQLMTAAEEEDLFEQEEWMEALEEEQEETDEIASSASRPPTPSFSSTAKRGAAPNQDVDASRVQVIRALELWIKRFSPPGVDATLESSWQLGASEDGSPMNRPQRRAAMRAQGLEPSEQPAPKPYIPFPTLAQVLEHALDPVLRLRQHTPKSDSQVEAKARSHLQNMAHRFALLADFALDLGDGPDRRTSTKLQKYQVRWLKSLKTIAMKTRNEASAVESRPPHGERSGRSRSDSYKSRSGFRGKTSPRSKRHDDIIMDAVVDSVAKGKAENRNRSRSSGSRTMRTDTSSHGDRRRREERAR